jgi:uncharacterized protein YoxC
MTVAIVDAVHFAQPAVAAAISYIFRQDGGVVQRSLLERLADLSQVIIALAVLGLLVLFFVTINELKQSQKKLMDLIEKARGELAPTISNVNELSANANFVADALAHRVGDIDETVALANSRMRGLVARIDRRARQFDAMLEVMQREFEDVFLSGASLIHGLKRGAGAITSRRRSRHRHHRVDLPGEDDLWDDFDRESRSSAASADGQREDGARDHRGPTVRRRGNASSGSERT